MKKIILISVHLLLLSCVTNRKVIEMKGQYESTCFLQSYPELVVTFSADSTFEYTFAYLDTNIVGKWTVFQDTIFLKSLFFDAEFDKPLAPAYKYTSYSDDMDAYFIKNRSLYRLDTIHQVQTECFLRFRKKKPSL